MTAPHPSFADRNESPSFDTGVVRRDSHASRRQVAVVLLVTAASSAAGLSATQASVAATFVTGSVVLSALVALSAIAIRKERRRSGERVVIENGVVRVARYVGGRLVDQRRFKAFDLVIERLDAADSECLQIALRGNRRRIEIASHFSPRERAKFLEAFVGALRETGVSPQIRRRCVSSATPGPLAVARGLPSGEREFHPFSRQGRRRA